MGKYDGQYIHDFLSPSGTMISIMLKLESSSNPRFDLKPLKLPESVMNRLLKKCANDELCGSLITEFHFSDDGTEKATFDIYASAVSYYLLALFSYIIHPLNRKNDFWFDSSHWFLKLLYGYFEFFMPSPSSDSSNVFALSNMLNHITETTPMPGLMYRTRMPEVEVSISMTKLFTECFVEMLLVPISVDASKLPINGPSLDHIRVVRSFLRHLHSVVMESAIQPQPRDRLSLSSPGQTNFQQTLRLYEEFYHVFMASTLHTPLLNFFSLSILNWPNEMPLRVIVECWLTYLQPWRIKPLSTSVIADNEVHQEIATWQSFIETNLVFYTQIFQNLLPHLLRMDPCLLVNCSIIFRIGKVFAAHSVLKSIIKENEHKLCGLNTLNNQTANYKPMFCTGIIQAVGRLLETCIQALGKLKNNSPEKETESDTSFWKSLFSPSMGDENAFDFGRNCNNSFGSPYLQSPDGSKMSLIRQLEEAINSWCALFDIDRVQLEKSLQLDHKSCSPEEDIYPEHVMGEFGPELTAKGRWQIITGKRKFIYTFAGDPDLQPVKSFEFAFLVRLCVALSNFLNEKYKFKIEKIYNREDWLCNLIKFFFIAGPLKFSPQKMAPQKSAKLRSNKFTYSPHLTLRFMASYYTLIYFVISILLCHFLMPSWLICLLASALIGCGILFSSTIGSAEIDTS